MKDVSKLSLFETQEEFEKTMPIVMFSDPNSNEFKKALEYIGKLDERLQELKQIK